MASDELAEAKIYCTCMEEIKTRLYLLAAFFKGKGTGSEVTDVEFGCLQFRKVLELIALASIAPNKEKYAEQRKKFHEDWNPRLIFRDLERINPDFYPIPIVRGDSATPNVKHYEEFKDGYLTKADFESVYIKCGAALHARNPFGAATDIRGLRKEFQDWVNKIMGLLNMHRMHPIDSSKVWVVMMKDAKDGKVHAYIANTIAGPGE